MYIIIYYAICANIFSIMTISFIVISFQLDHAKFNLAGFPYCITLCFNISNRLKIEIIHALEQDCEISDSIIRTCF